MTDARFPERWLNDRRITRLSDRAFRTFVLTLTWSAANRTDGHLELDDLALIHGADERDTAELLAAALWEATGDRAVDIIAFDLTQTTARQLEAAERARIRERDKKRRQRAHRAGDHTLCAPDCDVSRGTSRETTQDRPGQDRQQLGGPPRNGWPTREISS